MTAARILTTLIHRHMSSAAVDSGWVSAVDPAPWVRLVSGLIPAHDRPARLGYSGLADWLAARGLAAGRGYVLALREAWIRDAMAAAVEADI